MRTLLPVMICLAAVGIAEAQTTVTDVQGNVYGTVQIGAQIWMSENLRTAMYQNGDPIPGGLNDAQWSTISTGAWASPDNNFGLDASHGKLYNWYAISDSRGICPAGWHVPSRAEFEQLRTFLGGELVAGGALKALTGWDAPNEGATNSSGFSAVSAACRNESGTYSAGEFGQDTFFWTATPWSSVPPGSSWNRSLYYYTAGFFENEFNNNRTGYSCRCVRDASVKLGLININQPDVPLASSSTDLQTSFKICADGSRSSMIRFVCDTCDLNDVVFKIKSDPDMLQLRLSGGVEAGYLQAPEGDTLRAWLTHPSYVPSWYLPFRPDTLLVIDTVSGDILFMNPIEYYRAPVLFMHGLIANSGTFEEMSRYFIGQDLYPGATNSAESPLLLRKDYSASNTSRFLVNRYKVRDGIRELITKAVNAGYSCDKAISVGHSMGGILTRLYLQSAWNDVAYMDDLHAVITLNTPHFGAQSANYLLTEFGLLSTFLNLYAATDTSSGAFYDLKVDSYATRHLLNGSPQPQEAIVPSAVLSSTVSGDGIMSVLFGSVVGALMFDDEENDAVVPLSSQRSGLTTPTVVPDQMHMGAAANQEMIFNVYNLLCEDSGGPSFLLGGFPTGELTYTAMTPIEHANHSCGLQRDVDTLELNIPFAGQIYSPNDMVEVSFTSSPNLTRISLFVSGKSITPFAIDNIVGTEVQFQVPDSALGILRLNLLGADSTDWIAFAESYVNVLSSVVPDSISTSTDTLHWALGTTEHVAINGFFGYTERVDLTDVQGLSVAHDPTYIAAQGNGNYRGIALGLTSLIFSYQGVTDTLVVVVEDNPAALLAAFNNTEERVCQGGTIFFMDASQGLVTGYEWSFPGGVPTTSTDAGPVVEYPTPGSYTVSLITHFVNGSDTLVIAGAIEVLPSLELGVTGIAGSLFADAVDVSYQWLDCGNGGQAIPGANGQEFTPGTNGLYAVRVNNGACIDTSACYAFISTGLDDNAIEDGFRILPNPTDGRFRVLLPPLTGSVTLVVRDIAGREIWSVSGASSRQWDFELTEGPGLYFVDVYSELGRRALKLVKR